MDQASLIYVDEYDQSEATAWEMACKEMLIPIGEFRKKNHINVDERTNFLERD